MPRSTDCHPVMAGGQREKRQGQVQAGAMVTNRGKDTTTGRSAGSSQKYNPHWGQDMILNPFRELIHLTLITALGERDSDDAFLTAKEAELKRGWEVPRVLR